VTNAATMLTAHLIFPKLAPGWAQSQPGRASTRRSSTQTDQLPTPGPAASRGGGAAGKFLILLATAAIAQGGLITRLMRLPRAAQASASLAAETSGVGLEAASAVKEVLALQDGLAITVEGTAQV